MSLDLIDWKILGVVDERAGSTALQVADEAKLSVGLNGRMRSGAARSWLKSLEGRGLVAKMDDLKPICWVRTTAGTEALAATGRMEG